MLIRELLFKTWYLLLGILIISLFMSTLVNPTIVILISMIGTLIVLIAAQKSLKS